MAQPFLSPRLFTHRLSPRLALVQLPPTPVPYITDIAPAALTLLILCMSCSI